MKIFTQSFYVTFLIMLGLGFSQKASAQTDGDYRTRSTGALNWSGATTWQVRAASAWANTATAPTATASVYIQAGSTVTVDVATADCNNLSINQTSGVVSIGANKLQVSGKLRGYTGTAVFTTGADGTFYSGQTVSTLATPSCLTSTAGSGKLSFIGSTRAITVSGEWGATSTGFDCEINLTSGQTATPGTNLKAANWTMTSGILDCSTTARIISADNGTTGGAVTVASGFVWISAGSPVLQRTGSTSAASLTLNSGAILRLTAAAPSIAATTLTLSGTVDYNRAGIQTLAIAANSGGNINTYTNLTLSGTSAKTLGISTTVNGTLSLQGTTSLALGGFTLTYGLSSTLEYAGSAVQTSATTEFPATGVVNLIVNNTSGFRLQQSKTVSGNVTITAGDVQNLSGTAVTLTMTGASSVLAVAGSITGTNVGAGNDINLVYTNTTGTLTINGAGSLCKFLNVTNTNTGSTVVLVRNLTSQFGAFTENGILQINGGGSFTGTATYGASSKLAYNAASYTTTTNEFPATGVKNVDILAPTGTSTVTLDGDKTISGALAVGANTLNGGKSINSATITISTGSMAMGDIVTSGAFTCSGAAAISLTGAWSVTSFVKSTSTVTFTASGNLNNATSFYNLTNSGGTRSILTNTDVENTLLVSGGDMRVSGGSGKTLTMSGSNATINITSGSITGTDASAGNDLSLVISGALTTLTGNATVNDDHEKKFFNVTVNSGSTLALSRGILCRYGSFTVNGTLQINGNGYVQTNPASSVVPSYNASSGALTYNNGGPYTNAAEWPATNSPFNVTVQNSSSVTLSGDRGIAGTLTLNPGTVNVAAFNLTIGASGAIIVPSPSATSMVIASSTGQLRKTFTATGSFTYPIGDNIGTAEYSPATLNFTAGTLAGYAGMNVANSKQTNNSSATDFINRYWSVTTSGITSPTCTASFTYVTADVAGTEGNLYGGRYLSSTWNCMGAVNTGTHSFSNSVSAFGDFTAGETSVMGCCSNPTSGGTIANASSSVCNGSTPAAFTSTTAASGQTGTLEYKWQSSTTGAGSGFSDVGATGLTYAPGALTATSWFKRLSKVTCSGTWAVAGESNVVQITVNPNLPASVSIAASPSSTICSGTNVTFTATPTNGGTPSYQWKLNGGNVGTNSATYSNNSLVNTDTVTVVMTSTATCATGSPATSNTVTMTVNAAPTASVISGSAAICAGSTTNLQVGITGGASPYTVVYSGGTLNSYASATNIPVTPTSTTTYTLISVTDANGCAGSGNSGSATVTIDSTTSTDGGLNWSNGTPSATKSVIFDGSAGTIGADMAACSLRLINNATVTVSPTANITLNGAITVAAGSTFTLSNNSNLIQNGSNYSNSGDVIVQRNSAALKRLDYTLWSSPVAGQELYAFSPFTFANRFYTYDSVNDVYAAYGGFSISGLNPDGVNGIDGNHATFDVATGYLIRLPWNHPTAPVVFNGIFKGTPHNGTVSRTGLTNGKYYAIGNPYPSTIDADQFIADNSIGDNPLTPGDGLYFWRKTNNSTASSYATYTTAGGVASGGDTSVVPIVPNGVIQVGEGFIVKTTSTSLVFNRGQRIANNGDQFLRTAAVERHRIWLNLSDGTANINQMMVAYMTGATQGIDAAIDGRFFNDSPTALNSLLNNEEFAIQGRSLPFDSSDIVPLAFKAASAGNYSIAIDHVDGLFAGGAQVIYLKDNLNNIYHNLNTGAYTFATTAGTFNDRFDIVYQNQLSNPVFTANAVVIYSHNNGFVINSGNFTMSSVKVFDIRGRLIEEKKGINANEATINGGLANEVLLVQITSEDGAVVTRKVVR